MAEIPRKYIPRIARFSFVRRIDPDVKVRAFLNTSIPVIKADLVWKTYNYHGENQTIAILDTGIWAEHPDFQDKILAWLDLINSEPEPYDDNGHGTAIAGIAAGSGKASNGTYRGVAYKAKLVILKVLDKYGQGYISTVISGLEWVVDNKDKYNISVVCLSLGTSTPSDGNDPLSLACDSVVDHGIVVVVAAGNFGPKPYTIGAPAAARKVITVGAVDRSMEIASWSSRGPTLDGRYKPDVCAVGVNVIAPSLPYYSYPDMTQQVYRAVSGTSIAAAMVAGAVALIKQAHPDWNPEKIKAALMGRAVPRDGRVNNDYGFGVINVFDALKGPVPTLVAYTWKLVKGVPTELQAKTCAPRSPNPYVLVEGRWFAPNSEIRILFDNDSILGSTTANSSGKFEVNVTLPLTSWGIHYICAWNLTSFITQISYVILTPTIELSMYKSFQTTTDIAKAGAELWARGQFYDPNISIIIKWDNSTILADNVTVDCNGTFLTKIIIPQNAEAGVHYISTWVNNTFIVQKEIHLITYTPVGGVLREPTVWTKYGSPYVLVDDLIIYKGAKLIIEPGVTVISNGLYCIWICENATLEAIGTKENPIVFTVNKSVSDKWFGIRLHYNANNTLIYLKYVKILDAMHAILGYISDQTIDLSNMSLTITYCEIINCVEPIYICGAWTSRTFRVNISYSNISNFGSYGIKIEYFWTGLIYIINNVISFGNGNGIELVGNGLHYEIDGNTIIFNKGNGIYIDCTTCYGVISRNFIAYNKDCLLYTSPSPRDLSTSRMPSSA
mgnify:CR=1 FL=1